MATPAPSAAFGMRDELGRAHSNVRAGCTGVVRRHPSRAALTTCSRSAGGSLAWPMATRRLLNNSESATRDRLFPAATGNDAEVWPKVRVADVLQINGTGISRTLFDYALRAHFDFVVVDAEAMPLFAVEFDGPHHDDDRRAIENDLMKNELCSQLGLPLARVRPEHVERSENGLNYVRWLAELYFASQAIQRAQEDGCVPVDEPLDPMLFITHWNLAGQFPLWLAKHAAHRIAAHAKGGRLGSPRPWKQIGCDEKGTTLGLAVIATVDGSMCLVAGTALYLVGFGVTGSEAVEQLMLADLAAKVQRYVAGDARFAHPWQYAIEKTISLLTRCGGRFTAMHSSGGGKFGYGVTWSNRDGRQECWVRWPGGELEIPVRNSDHGGG